MRLATTPGTEPPASPPPNRESVIHVFDLPAIAWTLTLALLLGGGYYALQATRSRELTGRVNNGLHALMHVAMASMMWNLGPTALLAQMAVLIGAALWFLLQVVARPELKALCAGSRGRLKCGYHSLTMVGAALMVAMMMGHVSAAGRGDLPEVGSSVSVAHHAMSTTPSLDLSTLMTIFFGIAALVFVFQLVRLRLSKTTLRVEHGFEALGATIMAVMFSAMA